ncbi:MAG: hypothetical protein QOD49_2953 [Actinomycetota bacterium]|nr:hypothetical protein [Actinomycetota bacterium]
MAHKEPTPARQGAEEANEQPGIPEDVSGQGEGC